MVANRLYLVAAGALHAQLGNSAAELQLLVCRADVSTSVAERAHPQLPPLPQALDGAAPALAGPPVRARCQRECSRPRSAR